MNERVLEIMRYFDLSQAEFADALEVTRGQISHISSGRNKPGVEFLVRVLETYPDVSSDWLLMGKGPMLKSGATDGTKAQKPADTTSATMKAESNTAQVQPAAVSGTQASESISGSIHRQQQGIPLQALARPGIKRLTIYYDDNTYEDFRLDS